MKEWIQLSALLLVFVHSASCQDLGQQSLSGFEVQPVNEVLHQEMLDAKVFGPHSPVSIDRLKLVKVRYVDFEGNEKAGEVMVLDACSQQVMNIFRSLYEQKFPMQAVALITVYGGSDSVSMAANNTSAHNLRAITGGSRVSLHGYGTAIDLNPVQNPYVGIACDDHHGVAFYEPVEGIKYANRMENRLGKQNRKGMAEEVLDVFSRNGFYWWGGYWNCPIDYQHFQVSRSVTELLVAMDAQEATEFFVQLTAYFNKYQQPIEDALELSVGDEWSLADYYLQNPQKFREILEEIK